MRLFGGDKLAGLMSRLGLKEGEAIEHRWLNHTVERAQRKVEEQNFSIRKRTLQYDDVMNRQRTIVYGLRQDILMKEGAAHDCILDVFNDLIVDRCEGALADPKDADPKALADWISNFPIACSEEECKGWVGNPQVAATELFKRVEEAYQAKCEGEIPEALPMLERMVCLTAIDEEWQKFLAAMDDLRRSVSLRGYGQRDPLVEYKREAFTMFDELMGTIKAGIVRAAFTTTTNVEAYFAMRERAARKAQTVHQDLGDITANLGRPQAAAPQPQATPAPQPAPQPRRMPASFTVTVPGLAKPAPEPAGDGSLESLMKALGMQNEPAPAAPQPPQPAKQEPLRAQPKVGRNDPCPCGSGKKYKNCCGKDL